MGRQKRAGDHLMLKKGINAPKKREWEFAIKRALAARGNGNMEVALNGLAHKLIRLAQAGDKWAIEEIGNRIDGKAKQAIVGDEESAPVKLEGRIKLVKPTT